MILNIIILCLVGLSNGLSEESCFVNGECKSSTNVGGQIVQNEKDCLRLCKSTTGDLHLNEYLFKVWITDQYHWKIANGLPFLRTSTFVSSFETVSFLAKRAARVTFLICYNIRISLLESIIMISGCVSGQQECDVPKPVCFVEGVCYGVVLDTSTLIETRYLFLFLSNLRQSLTFFD